MLLNPKFLAVLLALGFRMEVLLVRHFSSQYLLSVALVLSISLKGFCYMWWLAVSCFCCSNYCLIVGGAPIWMYSSSSKDSEVRVSKIITTESWDAQDNLSRGNIGAIEELQGLFPEPGRLQFIYADLGDSKLVSFSLLSSSMHMVMHNCFVVLVIGRAITFIDWNICLDKY
jgi:hypothetical protein